ncbi:MAG TPA: polymer-forming cytoskeletal protein [Actinomycetota bacterium]|nr:polymer-forming cytoskeletal protein [Actinomycetota bacterium]
MKAIALAGLVLASLSAAAVAQQTELGGKVRSGSEVTLPAGETVQGDLIASGGTVRIDGKVDGDLVASGGQVKITGPVTGDVLVAAGNTTISGQVDGDVRVASGQARLEGQVGEDVLLAAGQATVARGARIGGDLIFGAGQMTMEGAVAGSVLGGTGGYTRRGSVGGTEKVTVGQREAEKAPTPADRAFDRLRRYASILVIGLLMLWLVPRMIRGAADSVRRNPLVSFGVGILGFIGVIILLIAVILVTVLLAIALGLLGLGALAGTIAFAGALAVAIICFLFLLAVAFGAQATVGLALGRLVFRGGGRSFGVAFAAMALGVLVVVLISAIPVAGGWLEGLLVVFGLGALVLMLRPGRRRARDVEPAI